MLDTLKNHLQCPNCKGQLVWSDEEIRHKNFIVSAKIKCSNCNNDYFIKDEIAYFLTDLERKDLWKKVDSNLVKYLRKNPSIKNQLMNSPIVDLAPADLFFRSFIHEDNGEYEQADSLLKLSLQRIYTKEYNDCFNSQINYISNIPMNNKPILDIASGKGYLFFELVKRKSNHIIMSDFSPEIIRANWKKLLYYKLQDRASLFVFDARKTPFKDKSINLMTSNVGLNNIERPQGLLVELKRILNGDFYSIMQFFREADTEDKKYLTELHLEELNFLRSALNEFSKADFTVNLENICHSFSKPTPKGQIIQAGIDGLPIHDTTIQWSVVHLK